jgi:hypothetical protein
MSHGLRTRLRRARMMRIKKSRPYKEAEMALAAASSHSEVTAVVIAAQKKLNAGEFGHFLRKVTSRRAQLS